MGPSQDALKIENPNERISEGVGRVPGSGVATSLPSREDPKPSWRFAKRALAERGELTWALASPSNQM